MRPLCIGNAQGFWGDAVGAPARLAAQAPQMDVLTLDYLAEVSMSILAKQREKDPAAGYARDFIEVVRSLAPVWRSGRKLLLVTNAGGLNPQGCAAAAAGILRQENCSGLRIAAIGGDDVLPLLKASAGSRNFSHLESVAPLDSVLDSLVTANAYLGARPVAEALAAGAGIVITGRVADPSLTVGPCAAYFGWSWDDCNRLAGATVAGHLIECGTQVTGGISTGWMELDPSIDIGYPLVHVSEDGSCIVSKPQATGGRVTEDTVKEQLLYEIGDPANYLSPDATVSFLTLRVTGEGPDRVRVSGATGRPPPAKYKVSATFRAGYRATGMLVIYGRDAAAKARQCGEIVLRRLREAGAEPRASRVECLGAGDVAPVGPAIDQSAIREVVLRISVADPRRAVVERFTREMAPLITSGPPGITGYSEGRPAVHEVFGYWPTLIDRERVTPEIHVTEV